MESLCVNVKESAIMNWLKVKFHVKRLDYCIFVYVLKIDNRINRFNPNLYKYGSPMIRLPSSKTKPINHHCIVWHSESIISIQYINYMRKSLVKNTPKYATDVWGLNVDYYAPLPEGGASTHPWDFSVYPSFRHSVFPCFRPSVIQ